MSQTKAQLLEGKAANIEFSAGTAALPAITFTGDVNTGIYSPATDTVGVSTGGVQRTTVDSSGRLLVGVGSATANGGVLELSGGITFPATAVAASNANTLDDYEEGTFSPTITGATTAGTTTYTRQDGIYTKVGRVVHVSCWVTATAATGSGLLKIGGLPFTSVAYYAAGTIMTGLYNFSGGTWLTAHVTPSSSSFDVYSSGDDIAWQAQSINNEAQEYMIGASYHVS